jgi:hypothetical protein
MNKYYLIIAGTLALISNEAMAQAVCKVNDSKLCQALSGLETAVSRMDDKSTIAADNKKKAGEFVDIAKQDCQDERTAKACRDSISLAVTKIRGFQNMSPAAASNKQGASSNQSVVIKKPTTPAAAQMAAARAAIEASKRKPGS